MKKLFASIAIAVAVCATAAAEENTVNVYNWSDYIAEDTVAKFEADSGIKVRYDVFDSNEILEAKLLTGSTGYDVVVPSIQFMARQAKAGVFQKIDKKALANYGNLDKNILDLVAINDPDNTYGVPYMIYTVGLGYNVDKIAKRIPADKIGSWDMFFDKDTVAKLAD
jgi:putrescine transport system substrate-binding protein